MSETTLKHIAFIMDGNGRWAKKRGLPRQAGHVVGASTFRKVIEYCGSIGIKCVTVYAFSTENWKRPPEEVTAIMKLLVDYLSEAEKTCVKKGISVHFLGSKEPFGEYIERMNKLEESTKDFGLTLNIALNYGGRDDIVHAVNKLIAEGKTTITEEDITASLYTSHCPPPDLIVRTGAEKRLSNFLLWECAYSEFYFTDKLWPDFCESDVDECVEEFNNRKRRFGGV